MNSFEHNMADNSYASPMRKNAMDGVNRRTYVTGAIASAVLVGAGGAAAAVPAASLSNRAHFYARPAAREALIDCFTRVLGCPPPTQLQAPGIAEPVLAFSFPAGGSVSVEFTPEALDTDQARRGAWLELRTPDAEALEARILAAGFDRIHYSATPTFYFQAPGGQVFGIVAQR